MKNMLRKNIRNYKVLAIETSCDDTATAILCSDQKTPLAETIINQHALHAPKGGIVPYMAAEAHRKALPVAIQSVLRQTGLQLGDIDIFCATRGPGIAGCLTVGYNAGKLLAAATMKPFRAVHHMEGHALVPRMTHKIEFPFLCLLVSGGHTMLVLANAVGDYVQLGTTLDDSVGEAIDKAARMLNIPYDPLVGPAALFVKYAINGRPAPELRMQSPRSPIISSSLDFSFSGLKTHFKALVENMSADVKKDPQLAYDLARSFLDSCVEHISDRIRRALNIIPTEIKHLVISGGVARNEYLVSRITKMLENTGISPVLPHPSHCTDNATMIAWVAKEYLDVGKKLKQFNDVKQEWPMQDIKLDVLNVSHESSELEIT